MADNENPETPAEDETPDPATPEAAPPAEPPVDVSVYTSQIAAHEATIAELTARTAQLEIDLAVSKAANYDLLLNMPADIDANPVAPDSVGNEGNVDIDDLFEDKD